MKQCETCAFREHRNEMVCCCATRLHFAWLELLRSVPLIEKYMYPYTCEHYLNIEELRDKGDDDST